MTMLLKTKRWDPVEHLDSDEKIRAYLQAAEEVGDPDLLAAAPRDVERARARFDRRGDER
jgi:DNA-binding phage protein